VTRGRARRALLSFRLASGSIIPTSSVTNGLRIGSVMNHRAAGAFLGKYIDESSHQQGRWRDEYGALSSATQSINPEASIEQQSGSAPFINATQATPCPHHEPEQSLPLDQIGVPEATWAWDRDARTGKRKDVATARSAVQRFRFALVTGTVFAALGLGWIGGFYFRGPAPARTALAQTPTCSDHAIDSGETSCVMPKSDREAIQGAPNARKIAAPTATAGG
jgi:hypothetical protein